MTGESDPRSEGQPIAGRVTEFVRLGDTVRRPATGSTESMRQLLVHLERSGFKGAPRVVNSEPDGGVVLTWIDGWAPTEAEEWKLDAGALASVGELLRSYHDCVRGFAPDGGFEEGPQAVAEGHIVGHGDVAARNTVFRDGRAAAFIDWEGIWVTTPLWDLGHAVWQFGPVCDDGDPWLREWPEKPDRSARIAALVGGYCLAPSEAPRLAEMVVEVIAGCHRSVARKAAAGIPAFVRMQSEGVLDVLDRQRRAAERSLPLIQEAALQASRWEDPPSGLRGRANRRDNAAHTARGRGPSGP